MSDINIDINQYEEQKKHSHYINSSFQPKIDINNIFTIDEKETLLEYGAWLEALANGLIKPLTKKQVLFIDNINNCDYSTENLTLYEKTWIKYKVRLLMLISDTGLPVTNINKGNGKVPSGKIWQDDYGHRFR